MLRHEGCIKDFCGTQAVECLANSSEWQQSMQIKPRGINESLTIDLSIICDCPCDRPGHRVRTIIECKPARIHVCAFTPVNRSDTLELKTQDYKPGSKDCRGNGTLICGVCSCNDGFYGRQCECEGNEVGAESAADMEECKASNESAEICSGHGACKCGVCDCARRQNPQELFYGKYCECDNFSCKRSGGLVSERSFVTTMFV